MQMEEIERRIVEIVARQFYLPAAEVTRGVNFVSDLNADSLDALELIFEIEDEFDISVPDEVVASIDTVGKAVEYVAKAMPSFQL